MQYRNEILHRQSPRGQLCYKITVNVKSVHSRTMLSDVGHSVLLCYIMAMPVVIG